MGRKRRKAESEEKNWYIFDAKGKILGRLATQIATILQGKNKVEYVPYKDMGDNVVVINAKDVMVSGRKTKQKFYTSYSGYPGGLKEISYKKLQEKNPEEIILRAVGGMLPKNKLARQMIKKLYVYQGEEHPYKDKFLAKGESTAGGKDLYAK